MARERRVSARWLWVLAAMALVSFPANAVTAAELQSLLQQAIPGFEIQVAPDPRVGLHPSWQCTATAAGQRTRLAIVSESEFSVGAKGFVAAVVRFPEEEKKRLSAFGHDQIPGKAQHPALLVLGCPQEPGNTRAIPIDARALALVGATVGQASDHALTGGSQLQVRVQLRYGQGSPRQYVYAERVLLYALPDLREMLSATTARYLASQGVGEIKTRRLDFVKVGDAPHPEVRLLDLGEGAMQRVPFETDRYPYKDDVAWDPAAPPEPASKPAPGLVRLEVVDPQGAPVANARMKYGRAGETLPSLTGLGSHGEVALAVKVEASGYHPAYCEWSQAELPTDSVKVTLIPAKAPVPMVTGSLGRTWDKPGEVLEVGVVLAGPRRRLVDKKEESAVWIRLQKKKGVPPPAPPVSMGEETFAQGRARLLANARAWEMTLAGMNGWMVCAGPKEVPAALEDASMDEAPADGYVEQIKGTADQFPQGVYLRSPDGKRYGKLAGLKFQDMRQGAEPLMELTFAYALQKETGDSRSLNAAR